MHIMDVDPQREPRKLRNLIGVQLQSSGLPDNMTVEESLNIFSAYHGVPAQDDLLSRMGLEEKRKTQYHQLSTGQQRRLALALALNHNPQVIILDEPTAGLDVASRSELHSLMQELKSQGTTLILATHDMAEAEKMTDRIAILLRGKIVATGSPRELTAKGSGLTKVSVSTENSFLHQYSDTFPAVTQQGVNEEYTIYFSTDPGPTVSAILDYLATHEDKFIDLRVERPSLEERFLEITSEGGTQ
jgi:ABC-2 type transport system ATP-binding protein